MTRPARRLLEDDPITYRCLGAPASTSLPVWSGGIVHISANGGATALCGAIPGLAPVQGIGGPSCEQCLTIAD